MGAGPVDVGPAAPMAIGRAQPLPQPVRAFMEPRFGSDFADVRVHTDRAAHDANAALGRRRRSRYGDDIYFGAGRSSRRPIPLTAHELAHVVQQRQTGAGVAAKRIQPSFTASYPVRLGVFEVDMQTRQGALNTPPTLSGFDGYIRFVPGPGAPNSNHDRLRADRQAHGCRPARTSIRPACRRHRRRAARSAIPACGPRTTRHAAWRAGSSPTCITGPTPERPARRRARRCRRAYNFQPTPAGGAPETGQTQQPAQYGGGTGGVVGQTPGFKRSEDPADIRSAALFDTPGHPEPGRRPRLRLRVRGQGRGHDGRLRHREVGLRASAPARSSTST